MLPTRRRAQQQVAAGVNVAWLVAGAALGGLLLGLAVAKWAQMTFKNEFNHTQSTAENAQLRAKVEELIQVVTKYDPLAYKSMRLRFTKGVNKAVVLGLVDELLTKKEVNIWWLPDSVERLLYCNVISLMLTILDQVVEGMSMNLAGHNIKVSLNYLDLTEEEAVAALAASQAAVQTTMELPRGKKAELAAAAGLRAATASP